VRESLDPSSIASSSRRMVSVELVIMRAIVVGVFAPARYREVKIVCSSSEMVLQTMKHIVINPG
jgi:hypothetical protein